MKKIIVLTVVFILGCVGTLHAQMSVPVSEKVAKQFDAAFQGASAAAWERVDANVSLVRFTLNGEVRIAYFSRSGRLLMDGTHIDLRQSPEKVQESLARISQSFGALMITHVYRVNDQGSTMYYANLGNKDIFVAVITEPNGKSNILRKSKA